MRTTSEDWNQYQNFVKENTFHERLIKIYEYSGKTYFTPLDVNQTRFKESILYKDVIITITDNGVLKFFGDQIELFDADDTYERVSIDEADEMGLLYSTNDIEYRFFKKIKNLKYGYYRSKNEKRNRIAFIETNFKYFPSLKNFRRS